MVPMTVGVAVNIERAICLNSMTLAVGEQHQAVNSQVIGIWFCLNPPFTGHTYI
jgi:hypothetical protein